MGPTRLSGNHERDYSRRDTILHGVAILAACIIVRVALIAVACWKARIGLAEFALMHDGWEYLRMSRAFAQLHPGSTGLESLRLFPGYPIVLALLSFGRYFIEAGLVVAVLPAAVCALLMARLGGRRELAWGMVALLPSWLVYTSTVMSEGLSNLLALGGLMLLARGSWAGAGFCAGFGAIVRPVGAFLYVPILLEAWSRRNRRGAMLAILAGLPWPLLYVVGSKLFWGDAFRSMKDYSGTVEAFWPLESLLRYSLDAGTGLTKKGLVWGTLAITAAGAVGLWKSWREGRASYRALLGWHVAAAVFYLLTPGGWVFGSIDRYLGALWPTALIGISRWLPARSRVLGVAVLVLSAISFYFALRWLVNLSAVYPFAERAFQ